MNDVKHHTVPEAQKNLSELIRRACQGEEVVIACGKKLIVKLVQVGETSADRVPGGFEGEIKWTDDAFGPLSGEEMRDLGFE